jgi:serine/threonine-protein kinase
MRVIIEVTQGPDQGRAFTFEGHDTFLVGRSRRAHFRLPQEDRYFSRIHFLVEVNPPKCRLMDMGSKNGTYVNGQRVSLVDLRDGDQIQGGKTVLRVRVEATPGGETTSTVPAPIPMIAAAPERPLAPVAPAGAADRNEGETCRACGAALTADTGGELWRICAGCQTQSRALRQPIRGFRLVRELGSGEVGTTYVALREATGQAVALKLIAAINDVSRDAVARFVRDAEALRLLSHPYVTPLREVGESGGHVYVVSDFVRGTDAGRLVATRGPLPSGEAVEVICQVLEALDHAHAEGYVHRGLKPTNLCVTDGGMVRLLDFGLSGLFRTSEVSGLSLESGAQTMPFLAPEQVTSFREVRPTADQYSTAAVLYFLLSGQHTHDFPASFRDRMMLVLQEEPVPIRTRRPDVPVLLAEVLHRALAKEPAARFPDTASMLQALTNCGC